MNRSSQESVDIGFYHRLRVNVSEGWRQRLGTALRNLAEDLDGRDTFAIEILTLPPLDHQTKRKIIRKGFDHVLELIRSELHHEVMDVALRELRPDLCNGEEKE